MKLGKPIESAATMRRQATQHLDRSQGGVFVTGFFQLARPIQQQGFAASCIVRAQDFWKTTRASRRPAPQVDDFRIVPIPAAPLKKMLTGGGIAKRPIVQVQFVFAGS